MIPGTIPLLALVALWHRWTLWNRWKKRTKNTIHFKKKMKVTLKTKRGKISFDVPVEGTIEGKKLQIGEFIWHHLVQDGKCVVEGETE